MTKARDIGLFLCRCMEDLLFYLEGGHPVTVQGCHSYVVRPSSRCPDFRRILGSIAPGPYEDALARAREIHGEDVDVNTMPLFSAPSLPIRSRFRPNRWGFHDVLNTPLAEKHEKRPRLYRVFTRDQYRRRQKRIGRASGTAPDSIRLPSSSFEAFSENTGRAVFVLAGLPLTDAPRSARELVSCCFREVVFLLEQGATVNFFSPRRYLFGEIHDFTYCNEAIVVANSVLEAREKAGQTTKMPLGAGGVSYSLGTANDAIARKLAWAMENPDESPVVIVPPEEQEEYQRLRRFAR